MNSTYKTDHNRLFEDLRLALGKDLSRLTSDANGGRSILFVYPPVDEDRYIAEAQATFDDSFEFIDLRKLFVEFVDGYGWDEFAEYYEEDRESMSLFKSLDYDDNFLNLIISKIQETVDRRHYPVLIHTGCIYGMGFTNIDYMESKVVLKSHYPLTVFYPATVNTKDEVFFLGKQKASKYRCLVIK